MLRHHHARAAAAEGRFTRQHFIDDARQAVHVAGATEILLAARLLRAHVLGRSDGQSDFRCKLTGAPGIGIGFTAGARDAEVREHGVTVREQNVLRLHVAMHEALPMREVETGADFLSDAERVLQRQRPPPPPLVLEQALAQRAAGHVRLHVVQHASSFARIDERNDVGMGQLRGDADFTKEPFGPESRGDLRAQNLDGHLATVLLLVGEIDGRHAATAQLALDRITVRECGGNRGTGGLRRGHGAEN